MSLSVCIIAHNEEENLEGALLSAVWADDVVVVDCGSTDGTADIARRHGARLFSRPNLSNLNVNKNYSFDQARGEWILCLDADESLSEELSREIRARIAAAPKEDGFFFRRENSWFGRVLMHGGRYPDL